MCQPSQFNGFCFRNMLPYSFDYLMYPYYLAYTMGCYQIVINDDNEIALLLEKHTPILYNASAICYRHPFMFFLRFSYPVTTESIRLNFATPSSSSHQTFLVEYGRIISGVSLPFMVGCHFVATSGNFVARSLKPFSNFCPEQ